MRTAIRLTLAMLTVLAVTHYVRAQRAPWEPPTYETCSAERAVQELMTSSR